MKNLFCGVLFTGLVSVGLQASPIPMTQDRWDANPLLCRFRGGEMQLFASNVNVFAETLLPRAKRSSISASFRVDRVVGDNWSTVGVSMLDDERNFWHVALVKAPSEKGGGRTFELCEMRDGIWLAQNNLKIAFSESFAPWHPGETYRFLLEIDPEGITGVVQEKNGKILFRKRYLFSGKAVTVGRPALHLTGCFQGAFQNADAQVSDFVPAKNKNAVHPYQSDSFIPAIKGPAAGFFRVQKNPDGRWWVIDPLGRGIVLMGVDHVQFRGHYCSKLDKFPHWEKNKKKYASKELWEEETLGRLKEWGFNFLGAGCDYALRYRGMIHTVFLSLGDTLAYSDEEYYITPNEHRPCSAFPNVFHPDFAAYCAYRARKLCTPNKNDPWLFGYFIDNELAWWGRGAQDTGLFDAVMKKSATHSSKTALCDFLAARVRGDLAAFNRLWGTKLSSLRELSSLSFLPSGTSERVEAKREFLRLAAERYFSICSAAIRKADPNHLVMGARFAGIDGAHPLVWEVSGKYCDVVTFNCYPWADIDEGVVYMSRGRKKERVADVFEKYYNYVKKPMLITEWSFPALDAGLPSRNGAGQRFRDQKGRTAATSLFARTMLSLPFLLGYDYFMWVDEPALGITEAFPEDSNYGLVNENCEPYPLLTQMFASLQKNVGEWRMKPLPEAKKNLPKVVCPSPDVVLSRFAATSKSSGKKVDFARNGNKFRLVTPDGLVLEGALGQSRLIPSITWQGKTFGSYNAMVCLKGNQWLDASRLTDIQYRQDADRGVLELTGEYRDGETSFAITHRLTVFPDRPLVLTELVRVVNLAKSPLNLQSAYFRLYAPFNEVPQCDVPNLWKGAPKSCWLDKKDGRFVGFIAPGNSNAMVYFWVGHTKIPHPDAVYEFPSPVSLPHGASYIPSSPMYMALLLGNSGKNGWISLSDAVSEMMY